MPLLFSVVVCTHNRSDMLQGCLESLCRQTLDKSKYEVIVVDNNSSDDTRQVTEGFLEQGNFRHVLETKLGLCPARNRGWQEAQGGYVAYIDDDARAMDNWLETAENVIGDLQPGLDVLGGPYHPFYTSAKPDWFLDKYEIRDFGDVPKYLERGRYVSGSNMVWSKKALELIGGFNEGIGIVGNTLELGDETEAIDRLWQAKGDARIYASPDFIIHHWVPEFKMKVSYRLKRKFVEGQAHGNHFIYTGIPKKVVFIFKSVYLLSRAALRFIVKFMSYPYWQNWIVEEGARVTGYFGRILGVMGIRSGLLRMD